MCVKVTLIGRLGNNLFSYAFGRIIAEELGFELSCCQNRFGIGICGVPLDSGAAASLTDLASFFPNAPLQIPGHRFEEPIEAYELGPGSKWRGQTVDLNSVLQNSVPRQIRLKGYFQRYEYYAPYREKIRRWFNLAHIPCRYPIQKDDIVLNVRRGADFGNNNWTLPLSYYQDVLSSVDRIGRIYVCGTGIDALTVSYLARFRPIYYHGTPLEHFGFMMRFSRIAISNSTFAWWAAFLSDALEIYAPRFAGVTAYSFTGFEDVDLHTGESRYHEVRVTTTAKFALFRANPQLMVEMNSDTDEISFRSPRRIEHRLTATDSQRRFITWLVKQRAPISLTDIKTQYRCADFNEWIATLIRTGLLAVQPGYV